MTTSENDPARRLRHHVVGLHWVAAVACGAAYFLAVDVAKVGAISFACVDKGTRSAVYISLAATSGALLGFAITAVSVLLSLNSGKNMSWLFAQPQFLYARTILFGGIHALAVGTVTYTVLIIADTGDKARVGWEAVAVALTVLVLLRVHAVVRLLNDLLEIALGDRQKSLPTQPFSEPLDD